MAKWGEAARLQNKCLVVPTGLCFCSCAVSLQFGKGLGKRKSLFVVRVSLPFSLCCFFLGVGSLAHVLLYLSFLSFFSFCPFLSSYFLQNVLKSKISVNLYSFVWKRANALPSASRPVAKFLSFPSFSRKSLEIF